MTTQTAQYDHIGSKYDENAHTAMLKRAESYTVLRMVGPLAGKRVLDLAYGFGFYTRLLKQHGAAQVISIHISPEMVCLGHVQEQAAALGVTRRHLLGLRRHRPLCVGRLRSGHRHVFAQLRDQHRPTARHVPQRLRPPGARRALRRLHGQPGVYPQQAERLPIRVLSRAPDSGGGPVRLQGEICHRAADPFQCSQWSQVAHERALQEAGFRTCTWYPSEVSPEDLALYGEA